MVEESLNITNFDDVLVSYSSLNGSGVTVCVLDTGLNVSAVGINPSNVIGYNFIDSNSNFSGHCI